MKNLLVIFALLAVVCFGTVVYAGTLTPPLGEPSAQFYTLTEIYNFITNNTSVTEGGHSFDFSDSLSGGGKTLTEIYDALAGLISADKVKSGTTYLGTAGTLVPSGGDAIPNNVLSGKTFFGGSQADWTLQTGTMANNGTFALVASADDQAVAAGYWDGGTLAGDADLVSGNIKSGVNIFGVDGDSNVVDTSSGNATASLIASNSIAWVDGTEITGTLLGNLFNGTRTDGDYPGGNQANGGVDDYNNAKAPAGDRYSGSWTQCTEGNDWCGLDTDDDGVNDFGADAMDDTTGLIWSLPCNGAGCDAFSDAAPSTYTWSASSSPGYYDRSYSTVSGADVDASVLCSGGDHGISGWYLPHQKQLMQAYIDGSYGNLEASGVTRPYWSATTQSYNVANAWYTYLSFGGTSYVNKLTSLSYVRCVRPRQ